MFPAPGPRRARRAGGAAALPPAGPHASHTSGLRLRAAAAHGAAGGVAERACRRGGGRAGRGCRRVPPGPGAVWAPRCRSQGRARAARAGAANGKTKPGSRTGILVRAPLAMPGAPGTAAAAALRPGLGRRSGPPRPGPGCGVPPRPGNLCDSQCRAAGGLPARGSTPNYNPRPAGRKRRDAPQEAGYGGAAVALRRSRLGHP